MISYLATQLQKQLCLSSTTFLGAQFSSFLSPPLKVVLSDQLTAYFNSPDARGEVPDLETWLSDLSNKTDPEIARAVLLTWPESRPRNPKELMHVLETEGPQLAAFELNVCHF